MNQDQPEHELPVPDRVPQRINEGMPVYDREGVAVGVVKVVYFGGASEEAIERVLHPEDAPAADESTTDGNPFDADNVPRELRARWMKQGYMVIEGSNLTGVHRYIGPEQIEGVFTEDLEGGINDAVRLRVTLGELLNT